MHSIETHTYCINKLLYNLKHILVLGYVEPQSTLNTMQLRKTRNLEFLRPTVQVSRRIRVFDRTSIYFERISNMLALPFKIIRIYFKYSKLSRKL